MIEHHIRPKIQPFFDLLGTKAAQHKICPNTVTRVAFLSGIAAALALTLNYPKTALVLLLSSGLCDILDGTIARITGTSHPFGAYMDLISDRMVEAAMIIAFTIAYPQNSLAYVLFLSAVLLHFSTFVVAGALFPNNGPKSIHYDRSIVERGEAFIVFFVMILVPQIIFPLLTLFSTSIFLSGYTRYRRVKHYAQETP